MRIRLGLLWVLIFGLLPCLAQPAGPAQMGREIDQLLQEFLYLGNRPFQTKWPSGAPKEKLEKDSEGNINFTRFFPTGGYAVRYQRKPGKVIKLERYYGNGRTAILINQDERIIDYTSYWENGQKKAKYQKNRQTQRIFYDARDVNGKQVYPPPPR
ncbi:hypothetical protein JST97_10125 [bacterium]|nr:hypothetical protein [bacterium]